MPSAVAVPIWVDPALYTIIDAPAVLMPLKVVAPLHIGEVTVGVPVVATTTAAEVALKQAPVVCAVAVIEAPAVNADKLDFVHALLVTVVVPRFVAPEYKVITVPSAAVTVPLTEVAPTHIGEVTVGVPVTGVTVNIPKVAVPPPFITTIFPLPLAADGKLTTTLVPEFDVTEADIPFTVTEVALSKLVPLIVMLAPLPAQAEVGVKPVMLGVLQELTVTVLELALTQLPVTWAVAVIPSKVAIVGASVPVVQLPLPSAVAVPIRVLPPL